jgi:branched-chain amino acid transport system substrate-binding protein
MRVTPTPLRPLFVSLALAFAATSPAFAQAPIKIGFIGELSGPQAAVGKEQLDGLMLLIDRNGGKLGGFPVQVIKEDSQLKPDVANQLARKLVERDKVDIITGVSFSNIMMAIHKYVTDNKVILVGSNAGPSQIAGAQCSPYQFIMSPQGDQTSEAVGKFAAEKGYKRIFLLAPNYQAGKDTLAGFKRQFKGEIVDEVYSPLSQQDFSAELSQVSAAKPDAVFAFYPGGLGINFAKQYAQAGMMKTTPLLSTYVADAITLPSLGPGALGMISGGIWAPDSTNPASVRFVADFEKKYGRIPSNYAAQSYDAAQLLDRAIAKVGGRVSDKPAFMAALKAADFSSVRGAFKFNNNNFPIQDVHVLTVVKDAKGRPSLKTVATPFKNHQDAYHDKCPM